MHARLQIPEPAASDVDSVVTALEMAALFGSKGEGNEVVRWLKRAAESAGAEGHDARALLLARTAAELDDQLRSSPDFGRTPSEPPLPAANAPSAASARSGEAEALPIPLGRRSGFPKPPSRPSSATSSLSSASNLTSRPPAPSQRTQPPPKPSLSQRPSAIVSADARREAAPQKPSAPRVATASRSPTPSTPSRPSALPASARANSLTPAPSSVRATSSVKPRVAKAAPATTPSAPENPMPEPSPAALNGASDDEPNTITDGPKAPEENGARASAGLEMPIKFAKGSVCSRQTARVSVQASTEPGVYVMRLLDDDETTLPGRAVEGLLVLVDPDAKLPIGDSN